MMATTYKYLQVTLLTFILALGLIYLTQESADAFQCDERSYAGSLTEDGYGCINDNGNDCFVCIAKPIE